MAESYVLKRIFSEEKWEKEFTEMSELFNYVYYNFLCETCRNSYSMKGYYIEDYNGHQYWKRVISPLETDCAKILKIDLIYTISSL